MRARLGDSVSGRYRPAENSLLTKHVVVAGTFAKDAGSTPAASTIFSLSDCPESKIRAFLRMDKTEVPDKISATTSLSIPPGPLVKDAAYERWRRQIFGITWVGYAGFLLTRDSFS